MVSVHAGKKTNTLEKIKNDIKDDLETNRCIDILEVGSEEDQEAYHKIVFPNIKRIIPIVICSDNHDIKNYTVKQNLWIKADPTFEGLKQILFEPQYRVHIGENPPINPPVRINKVNFNFPTDTVFENEIFCLSRKQEIEFSPNFTCLIGGRGTGKSTILNLIHEKLKAGENKFFKEKRIKDSNGNLIPIDSSVKIDNDVDEKYIEFLSQNEVEEFAQDYQKLTSAIYSRIIKRDEEGLITKYETPLKENLDSFRIHIINKKRIISIKEEIERKSKELETNKKIVESFSSIEYKKINEDLKSITSNLNEINNSKDEYSKLIKELNFLIENFEQENPVNLYAQEIDKVIKGIKKLISDTETVDFKSVQKGKDSLLISLTSVKNEFKKYLSDKGLTEENLKDISNANIIINNLELEIKKKKEENGSILKRIESFSKDNSIKASANYIKVLEKQVKYISSILEKLGSDVKPISLQFEFDLDEANESIFVDFKNVFEGQIQK